MRQLDLALMMFTLLDGYPIALEPFLRRAGKSEEVAVAMCIRNVLAREGSTSRKQLQMIGFSPAIEMS